CEGPPRRICPASTDESRCRNWLVGTGLSGPDVLRTFVRPVNISSDGTIVNVVVTGRHGSPPSATSSGHVLAVLRAHGSLTRQELQERIGLSRVTLVERLDALHRHGFVRAAGHRDSSGGRRAEVLEVD